MCVSMGVYFCARYLLLWLCVLRNLLPPPPPPPSLSQNWDLFSCDIYPTLDRTSSPLFSSNPTFSVAHNNTVSSSSVESTKILRCMARSFETNKLFRTKSSISSIEMCLTSVLFLLLLPSKLSVIFYSLSSSYLFFSQAPCHQVYSSPTDRITSLPGSREHKMVRTPVG